MHRNFRPRRASRGLFFVSRLSGQPVLIQPIEAGGLLACIVFGAQKILQLAEAPVGFPLIAPAFCCFQTFEDRPFFGDNAA
jgi:hypothetical protein